MLIHSDNMSVVSYINHQGGLSSKRLLIRVELILEWAQLNLSSLRAAHLLGRLNQGGDVLSRSNVPSEEWMLHPQMVRMMWKIFGKAELDLFNSKDSFHRPTYYSKVRDALAHDWPNLLLYAFPTDCPDSTGHQANQGTRTQGSIGSTHWFYLPTVLRFLKGPPFEPLQSMNLRSLSLTTALLLALASVKQVGDITLMTFNLGIY